MAVYSSGKETAEHLLLSYPRWTAEDFGDSIDIKDVFQDYMDLVEFLSLRDICLPM